MVLPESDSLPKLHKRSVSDTACIMPFYEKQEGVSRYPLRNQVQRSSARDEADPELEAVELPKHTPQTSKNAENMGGSGDKVSAKAFITCPEKPVASGSLSEHSKSNASPVANDKNAADSATIKASDASETSPGVKVTSGNPSTSAHVAPVSGARAGTASASTATAITAPIASTPVTAAPVVRDITVPASMVRTAAPLPTPPNDQSSQDDTGSPTAVQSYGSIEIPDISFDPVAMAVDYWTRPGPGGHHVEAPKLPGHGRWQIPLPPNMNAALHVLSQQGLLYHYLGVRIVVRAKPPAIMVTLYPYQEYQELLTPFIIEDHIAQKWKAWKIIFDWVQHLEQRGQSPANLPIDIVTFVRNRLHAEGRMATDLAVDAIETRQREGALFEGATDWQLPRPPIILPQNLSANMHPSMYPNMYPHMHPDMHPSMHPHMHSHMYPNMHPHMHPNMPTNKGVNKPAAMPPNIPQKQVARQRLPDARPDPQQKPSLTNKSALVKPEPQTSQKQVTQKPSLTNKSALVKPEPVDDAEPMPLQNAEPNVAGQKKRRVVVDLMSDSEEEESKPKRARQKK